MLYGIYRVSIPVIDCDQLSMDSFVTIAFQARIKDHRPLYDVDASNAQRSNVPEGAEFMVGASQCMSASIKFHKVPEDYRFASSGPLSGARDRTM
jgi:hypothetical protein